MSRWGFNHCLLTPTAAFSLNRQDACSTKLNFIVGRCCGAGSQTLLAIGDRSTLPAPTALHY